MQVSRNRPGEGQSCAWQVDDVPCGAPVAFLYRTVRLDAGDPHGVCCASHLPVILHREESRAFVVTKM